MRTYVEALAAASFGSPFSNGTEWEIWSYNWCDNCVHESVELVNRGEGCPLITVGLMGRIPVEWSGERGDYQCAEFQRRDDPS